MSNKIENAGNEYHSELNELQDSRFEIEHMLETCTDYLESGESNYLTKLTELNEQITTYYGKEFTDFLDEMGELFTNYSSQFEELDQEIKARI